MIERIWVFVGNVSLVVAVSELGPILFFQLVFLFLRGFLFCFLIY
jgi:hypothetical protein